MKTTETANLETLPGCPRCEAVLIGTGHLPYHRSCLDCGWTGIIAPVGTTPDGRQRWEIYA